MTVERRWQAAAEARIAARDEEGKPFTGILTGNTEADERDPRDGRPRAESRGTPAIQAMYEANDNTFSLPANPADAEFKSALQDAVNWVLNGQASARGGARQGAGERSEGSRRGVGDAGVGEVTHVGARSVQRQPAAAEVTPERRRSRRRARRREVAAALLFLSPWLVGFLVFTAWPLIYSGYLSLTDYDVINNPHFVGLENYVRAASEDPKVALALGNTFFFTAMPVPLYVIVSLALALLLNRAGRGAGFFRTLFFLPKMTPPVAVGVLFLLLFNGQNGLVNTVLGWFGIDGPAWTTDPTWVKPGLIMMSLWTVGASVIILLAALADVPEELYDSARLDGAGFWRQTARVTVPMISPALFFVIVVNTIAALQTFDEAYTAFFGAGNTTYSNDAALFYVDLPVPAGVRVPAHGLRLRDGVAAVRHHHGRDRRPAARAPDGSSTTKGRRDDRRHATARRTAGHPGSAADAAIRAAGHACAARGPTPGAAAAPVSAGGRADVVSASRSVAARRGLRLPVRLAGERIVQAPRRGLRQPADPEDLHVRQLRHGVARGTARPVAAQHA